MELESMEFLSLLTDMSIKVDFYAINLMVREYLNIQMERLYKVNGVKDCCKEM